MPGEPGIAVDRFAVEQGQQHTHTMQLRHAGLEWVPVEHDQIGGLADLERAVERLFAGGPR